MGKWVFDFGSGRTVGGREMRDLLGGKGADLAEMSKLGLPVPPGFTLTTELCTHYYGNDKRYPDALVDEVDGALALVEESVGARFGDAADPLLVAVRSGARASMPGMMDTVLNLGLNDQTVEGLARRSGDRRFAFDSYRRFIQMYGDVVLGLDHSLFEDLLETRKLEKGVLLDTELDVGDLEELTEAFRNLLEAELGIAFPSDPRDQLWGAIGAVFGSWINERAITYRRLHSIPAEWGTAVNVQAMVFGNMGENSATGVAFTRDPATGEKVFYGEYLANAQGEDVVAGIRTPRYLTQAAREGAGDDKPSLEEAMPEVFAELERVYRRLELHYRDMQDIEFTVQRGRLYLLQTRTGKRTARAAIRIAVELAKEGVISRSEAVRRIDPASLDQLLHPTLDPEAERAVIATGLPASPGAACGGIVFNADEAVTLAAQGERVILVRIETSPEDIHGMHAAQGVLTQRGGMTSHAAVVARGMGRPCVSGAAHIAIDYERETMTAGERVLAKGEIVTLDGATGEVMSGEVATIEPALAGEFGELMGWADETRRLRVRANAETPADAEAARRFGAEGIGLCRTEHMFFEADRIAAVREMILSVDEAGRRAALARILPMQRGDFVELFRTMAGLPVTIRLLDLPLHEFLPEGEAELAGLAAMSGIEIETLGRRVARLREYNPMLGHRGCRLAISYPEIYEMQTRAIFEAALSVAGEGEAVVLPEVMVPLIATRAEFEILKRLVDRVAEAVMAEREGRLEYLVGTMIELPRAALRAGEIAAEASFFSFGTNDLTQTTYGISRDDSGSFLEDYRRAGILEVDPFVSLDVAGVGELIEIAVARGRERRSDLKLGICGEHGGDPASVLFCERIGLDYVSCSPFRVPIARLAAAQATLGGGADE